MKQPTVLVIDAQGGGLGRQLIAEIKKNIEGAEVLAVGTNATATAAMLKAGADAAATGENAVTVACRRADYIIGPVGIVIADAMLGEITPTMARAVAQANARRILIPFSNCFNYIAGVSDFSTGRLVDDALKELKKQVTERGNL